MRWCGTEGGSSTGAADKSSSRHASITFSNGSGDTTSRGTSKTFSRSNSRSNRRSISISANGNISISACRRSNRRIKLRAWAHVCAMCLFLHLLFLGVAANTPHVTIVDHESLSAATQDTSSIADKPKPARPMVMFSPEWEALYSSTKIGCHLGRKRYVWRPCGFGSNIIHMLNAFVYGLAVKKWSDVAVITPKGQLNSLNCTGGAGDALSGFDCLFRPMPHVCTFNSIPEWKTYMTKKTVRKTVQEESDGANWQYIRLQQGMVEADALETFGVDTLGALAIMARYLWSNLEPALEARVREQVESPALDVFRESPYVGLHIRRGDKVAEGEMEMVETRDYLAAAKKHLEDNEPDGRVLADDIRSIWVASDDDNAVEEVRGLASEYFPNVDLDNITWVSGGGRDGAVQTHSKLESYMGFVFILVDLQMLATSDVFVGTYTSNVSRLVAVLREAIGGKPRDSTISLDKENFGLNY